MLNKFLNQIADTFIFGNLLIAFCASALVLETYLLLGETPRFDGLTFFVFFSTLALYNFHRLNGIKRIKEEDYGAITGWAAQHQFTLLMLMIIGLGGAGFFVFQMFSNTRIFLTLIPLGAISLFYELPLVRFQKRMERIRNLWLSKAFLITAVWAITSALLPSMNLHFSWNNYNVWLIVTERMIFIFILALCFDSRDVEFDKRNNLKTIPIVYGKEKTSRLYKIFTAVFILLCILHYFILTFQFVTGAAMVMSGVLTYFMVSRTQPRRSDYYYIFFVDGMMIAQFILVLLAKRFS